MTHPNPINTDEELVAVLGDIFDRLEPPQSPEEVDEFLLECGYDPDNAGKPTALFVDELIRNTRRDARAGRISSLKRFESTQLQLELPATKPDLIEAIQQQLAKQGQQMSAQYRNFQEQTKEDLQELLKELLFLDEEEP